MARSSGVCESNREIPEELVPEPCASPPYYIVLVLPIYASTCYYAGTRRPVVNRSACGRFSVQRFSRQRIVRRIEHHRRSCIHTVTSASDRRTRTAEVLYGGFEINK